MRHWSGIQVFFLLSVPFSAEMVLFECLGKGSWVRSLDRVRHEIDIKSNGTNSNRKKRPVSGIGHLYFCHAIVSDDRNGHDTYDITGVTTKSGAGCIKHTGCGYLWHCRRRSCRHHLLSRRLFPYRDSPRSLRHYRWGGTI